MTKLKLHAERKLPYQSVASYTLCNRHVERNQLAAFDEGVTCKNCRNILNFRAEHEAERNARQLREQE